MSISSISQQNYSMSALGSTGTSGVSGSLTTVTSSDKTTLQNQNSKIETEVSQLQSNDGSSGDVSNLNAALSEIQKRLSSLTEQFESRSTTAKENDNSRVTKAAEQTVNAEQTKSAEQTESDNLVNAIDISPVLNCYLGTAMDVYA